MADNDEYRTLELPIYVKELISSGIDNQRITEIPKHGPRIKAKKYTHHRLLSKSKMGEIGILKRIYYNLFRKF
ncbi:hypothetical protein NBRC116492_10780 [Aurantivibrio infirmus]